MTNPANPDLRRVIVTADLHRLRVLVARSGASVPAEVEDATWDTCPGDTDRPGRFPRGGRADGRYGMSPGDLHSEREEEERRNIKELAERIETVVQREECEEWSLSLPSAISRRVVGLLSPGVRERLTVTLVGDLTGLPAKEVGEKFAQGAA